jgi:chorismate--pyruvate lyase
MPQTDEAGLLGCRRAVLIREVELRCQDDPRVFARTLIPATSLSGRARLLARLGERPLGAVLFEDRSTRRVSVEFCRLVPGQPLHAAATAHLAMSSTPVWGRRTLFRYAGQPLLVNEIFLPGVCA